MWEKLVSTLLKSVLNYIHLWWEKKSAEAEVARLRTKVALAESTERMRIAEVRISKAAPTIRPEDITPLTWNAGGSP